MTRTWIAAAALALAAACARGPQAPQPTPTLAKPTTRPSAPASAYVASVELGARRLVSASAASLSAVDALATSGSISQPAAAAAFSAVARIASAGQSLSSVLIVVRSGRGNDRLAAVARASATLADMRAIAARPSVPTDAAPTVAAALRPVLDAVDALQSALEGAR